MGKVGSIIVCCIALLGACSQAKMNGDKPMKMEWDTLAVLPPAKGEYNQPGLAGALSGIVDNQLVIAGGSNFENGMPWNGGTKVYHDDIFILKKDSAGELLWSTPTLKLSVPLGYSACLSVPEGLICLGGENADGFRSDAFLFSIENDSLIRNELPSIPQPVSNAGVAAIGQTIYLAGGLNAEGAANSFFALNYLNENASWQTLSELPQAVSHAVVLSQNDGNEDCIYVVGGRSRDGELSTFFSAIWKYTPTKQIWEKAGVLKEEDREFGLSAGTGIAWGDHAFLIFGGDRGDLFNRTEQFNNAIDKAENDSVRQSLISEKIAHLTNHPGFSKAVFCFNTKTCEMEKLGEIPGLSQVTTQTFNWENQVITPLGEIKPGVRTAVISRLLISEK